MKARGVPKRIVPLHDVNRPHALRIGHQDRRASGQGGLRPGEEVLGAAADLDAHLAWLEDIASQRPRLRRYFTAANYKVLELMQHAA
jgi:hypothetical protein